MPKLVNPTPPNATLVKADGSTINIQPKNNSDFQRKELYEHLNCSTIEIARSQACAQTGRANKDHILIIDEEGKLKQGSRINVLASEWYSHPYDHIVGNAILCHSDMVK